MKALVTGATGFLGRYIAEQLRERGDDVTVLIRRPDAGLTALGVRTIISDLTDAAAVRAACSGQEAVFHVAAVAGIWGSWESYYQPNTLGTRAIIAGCREHGVRQLIYTSSPSVTFQAVDQCHVDESAPYPTDWLAHYPHTKALAEQEVLAAHDEQGLLTCALRPHLIWGPRDRHLIPRLIARARAGQLRRVGEGKNLIDVIHVENAAAAHLAAADALRPGSAAGGKAYFLSQGEPVNCWEWIDAWLQLAGIPPIRRTISFPAAWRVGTMLETIHRWLRLSGEPRMTRFLAAQLALSHYYDISAARRDLQYVPRVSTVEGMARMADEVRKLAN